MRAVWCVLLAASGCSNILGIHSLSDADTSGGGDARRDSGGGGDGPKTDAALDASSTVPIGEFAQLSSSTAIQGNFIIARIFTVGGTTVVVGAGAYLTTETANGKIKFAIYNDNVTSPFTRRVVSGDITLDGTPGYNEIPIGPHTLSAGTYWMVMATDNNLDIGSLDTNNVTGAAASLPYGSAFPTTYSPQPTSSATSDRMNLYLKAQP